MQNIKTPHQKIRCFDALSAGSNRMQLLVIFPILREIRKILKNLIRDFLGVQVRVQLYEIFLTEN